MYFALFISVFNKVTDNGAHQQVINLYKTFQVMNIKCLIIIEHLQPSEIHLYDKCKKELINLIADSDVNIEMLSTDIKSNQLNFCSNIIFVTYIPKNNQFLYYLTKHLKINLYYLISANYINLFQEYIVSSQKKSQIRYIKQGFSRYLPKCIKLITFKMFVDNVSALEMYYDRKIQFIPHSWLPSNLINSNICNNQNKLTKYEFVIFEPNISITKNCFFPILIAKVLNAKANIHICCSNNKIKKKILFMFPKLSFFFHERVNVCSFLKNLYEKETIPIVVSHHLQNAYNYLSYELIYMNIPFIHNSQYLNKYGMFYKDNNLNNLNYRFKLWQQKKFQCSNIFREQILSLLNPHNKQNIEVLSNVFNRSSPT